MEMLRRCLASKILKYLRMDEIQVPKELSEKNDLLEQLKSQFNINLSESGNCFKS